MASFLTIPCHWDKKIICEILNQNKKFNKDIKINEIYGVLAKGKIPHGRLSSAVPKISKKKSIEFRNFIKSKGLRFNYLLNGPVNFNSNKVSKSTKNYLDWVINKFKPDAVTISSYELMDYVRKNYSIDIYISTISGVLTKEDVKKYESIKPQKITLHHDANKNFNNFNEILQIASQKKIIIELLLTESCLRYCPNRKKHYEYISNVNKDVSFHSNCNSVKLTKPEELLKSNFIRPEDVVFYEKMGITHFKITGRSKPANWLPLVCESYLKRSYDGNLIRLLGIDPSLKAEEWIFINNKSLSGFLDDYPKTPDETKENDYCKSWIIKLFRHENFKLMDDSEYIIENNCLICKKMSKNFLELYSKENGAKK